MKQALVILLILMNLQSTAQEISRKTKTDGTVYIIDDEYPVMPTTGYVLLPQIPETEVFPVVDCPNTYILKREDILKMPLQTDIFDMLTQIPGVYQSKRGKDVSIYGSRPGGNLYICDGMRLLR